MKKRALSLLFFILYLSVQTTFAQKDVKTISYPTIGSIEVLKPELNKLIKPNTKIEVLAEGFKWTEGALWVERENMLLFSDIPDNKIYKWTEAGGIEDYLYPSGYSGTENRPGEPGSNGLIIDESGNLLMTQHGNRQIARMDARLTAPEANFISLANQYNGKKLNSPNDLVQHKNGDVYFTDPPYGLKEQTIDKRELDFCGVYRIDKKGMVTLLIDSIPYPNGIGLTPDHKQLIVSNSDGNKPYLYLYNILKDGALEEKGIAFDFSPYGGGADGFTVDRNGNIYSSGPGGLWILNRNFEPIGRIRIPHPVSNCDLSDDEKTLYVTANHQVLRIRMR
ncbi:SMP-30/gluconolactonase/LRE family protein [Albibacterium indicum]|uniref:SMP-30/gluconolactonase/LRE family protein n=1 Tax=Albibacterium indicum TaxID=2292082 RepID=UPI000E4DAF4D|nr:SMP-30/gluconolactonase/LRE family protein [Pedobacter indicus]